MKHRRLEFSFFIHWKGDSKLLMTILKKSSLVWIWLPRWLCVYWPSLRHFAQCIYNILLRISIHIAFIFRGTKTGLPILQVIECLTKIKKFLLLLILGLQSVFCGFDENAGLRVKEISADNDKVSESISDTLN